LTSDHTHDVILGMTGFDCKSRCNY